MRRLFISLAMALFFVACGNVSVDTVPDKDFNELASLYPSMQDSINSHLEKALALVEEVESVGTYFSPWDIYVIKKLYSLSPNAKPNYTPLPWGRN